MSEPRPYVMVRVPRDQADRVKALGESREPYVREAVEQRLVADERRARQERLNAERGGR